MASAIILSDPTEIVGDLSGTVGPKKASALPLLLVISGAALLLWKFGVPRVLR